MPDPRHVRYRGRYYVEFYEGSRRRRLALGTDDEAEANRKFAQWLSEYSKPDAGTIRTLWTAYVDENEGKAVIATMAHTWKALAPVFADVSPEDVSIDLCRKHTHSRQEAGISDGTIWTELGHLRTVLNWGVKRKVIAFAPHVERPRKPDPREHHLTRTEALLLKNACEYQHVKLFVTLAITTAARKAALLDLKWDRVNFETGMIDLRNPDIGRRHKGRALVPMNRQARVALQEAKGAARSEFVIEWAGKQVQSVRRGLSAAARVAGLADVTPHVLRHSAAVWMAEAGHPMAEISQYLGHGDSRITEKVYARYTPNHLRGAASALEFDEISEAERKAR